MGRWYNDYDTRKTYEKGQHDYDYGRRDYDYDRHSGRERDEAYFQGREDREREVRERREEERQQEEAAERRAAHRAAERRQEEQTYWDGNYAQQEQEFSPPNPEPVENET